MRLRDVMRWRDHVGVTRCDDADLRLPSPWCLLSPESLEAVRRRQLRSVWLSVSPHWFALADSPDVHSCQSQLPLWASGVHLQNRGCIHAGGLFRRDTGLRHGLHQFRLSRHPPLLLHGLLQDLRQPPHISLILLSTAPCLLGMLL
jgi:hypothetical protein